MKPAIVRVGAKRRVVLGAVGIPLALMPLLAAALLGAVVPWERILRDLPGATAPDYASRSRNDFVPLREGFVRGTLGEPAPASGILGKGEKDFTRKIRGGVPELDVGDARRVSPPIPPETPVVGYSSHSPSVSADGTVIAYVSNDPNVPGMDAVPCLLKPPGPTTGSILSKDAFPCSQVVVYDARRGTTTLASIGFDGKPADAFVGGSLMLSGDGRFVVFATPAKNIIQGDTNDSVDVFVRDLTEERTELISVSMSGSPVGRDDDLNLKHIGYPVDQSIPDVLASASAVNGTISNDGRYVLFESSADDIVPGDTQQSVDVFLRDRLKRTTERVSVSWNGAPPPLADIHRDNNERIERFHWQSAYPCMSPNGRYVAFRSLVSNLVPDDRNDGPDIFLHDRLTRITEIVSVATSGVQGNGDSRPAIGRHNTNPPGSAMKNCISNDGRYVAFESLASNLVPSDSNRQWDIFLRDRQSSATRRINLTLDGRESRAPSEVSDGWVATGPPPAAESAALSPDGNFIAFQTFARLDSEEDDPTDGDNVLNAEDYDLFVYDIARSRVTRLDIRSYAGAGERVMAPCLTWGAELIAFSTNTGDVQRATSGVHLYRWKRS